jgi:hypothetical protein
MRALVSTIAVVLAGCSANGSVGGGAEAGVETSTGGADAANEALPEGPGGDSGEVADSQVDGLSPPDGGCGGLVWLSAACASCTDESCCDIERLCVAIPTCAPLNACWNACDHDAGCTAGCGMQYIDAISNYNAILNCQRNACAAQCAH